MRRILVVLLCCAAPLACASSPQPLPGPPLAADGGQPRMQAAIQALQQARAALAVATANKGGHRAHAIGLIHRAIEAVNAGMQYAAAHPAGVGPAEGPAAPEPVNEAVRGAERQPNMARAIVDLRQARRQLREARHDKGGHRVHALALVEQAIVQVREGIHVANTHDLR
jgi:hypothetical protein